MPRFNVVWVKTESDRAVVLGQGVSVQPDDTCATCSDPIDADEDYAVFADEDGDYWFTCDLCVMDLLDPKF